LREVLGDHTDQKGSLVAPTKLRFAQIGLPEIGKIEWMSFDWIWRNVRVYSKELDLQTAHKIPSLRAVFGESYPDPIRVVTLEYTYEIDEIAKDITNPKWRNAMSSFVAERLSGSSFSLCFLTLSSHVAKRREN
jgi:alanyl-tRNA synthetase